MLFRRAVLGFLASVVLLSAAAVPAIAANRKVKIVNNTSYTLGRFYGSNKGSDSWEEDILGSDILRPGRSVNINFDDNSGYCKFDFKALFYNRNNDLVSTQIKKNINICKINAFTYN